MDDQLNFPEIISKILVLYVFWNVLKLEPHLMNYKESVRFNVYRSLMCLTFTLLSLRNSILYLGKGYSKPFTFHLPDLDEIHDLFCAYIIFDIIKLLSEGNKRFDLYIHHVWCLVSFLISKYYGYCGFFHSFLLFNEIISVVSGLDSMAMEDGNSVESMKYKKVRKYIIKYVRLPIWIILFMFMVKYTNRMPKVLWWNGILTTILMIWLDRYWEKKCDKVINKYKNK